MTDLMCEFSWDIDESIGTDEWQPRRIQYVPMGKHDHAKVVADYGSEYEPCTQWLVYISHYPGQDDSDSVVAIPCAPDKSSPCDTGFYEGYDVDMYDDWICQIAADRLTEPVPHAEYNGKLVMIAYSHDTSPEEVNEEVNKLLGFEWDWDEIDTWDILGEGDPGFGINPRVGKDDPRVQRMIDWFCRLYEDGMIGEQVAEIDGNDRVIVQLENEDTIMLFVNEE
jgi:hypothetical protein